MNSVKCLLLKVKVTALHNIHTVKSFTKVLMMAQIGTETSS